MSKIATPYRPIQDYALIGDCRCAALISRVGAIDWLCMPRFDSPALFSALLDVRKGGRFSICPSDAFTSAQRYIDGTNVLQTAFTTAQGTLRLTDLMPLGADRSSLSPQREILRAVECLTGEVEVEVLYQPRLHYGSIVPRLTDRRALGIFCEHRAGVLTLRSEIPLELSAQRDQASGRLRLRAGERRTLSLAFAQGEPAVLAPLGAAAERRTAHTIQWWEQWASRCSYHGPYRDAVLRSALALKLLTYAPSGAVIAAPTTSLPECPGGTRNWDYRFCWLRDASMTLRALYNLGYREESAAFLSWLIHSTRLTRPELKVVYDVYGETRMRERELDHLEGYAGSRPVRVGNSAAEQLQLDVYGEVADGAFEFVKWGERLDRDTTGMLRGLGETVCRNWREPDEGIWEIRSDPQHHTFSKAMCWVTLDRLIKLHDTGQIRVPVQRFARERDAVRSAIETQGYSTPLQSYTTSFGREDVDVSLLLLPLFGYIEPAHPRMRSTYACIQERLGRNGLLYRYAFDYDGLPSGEGAFAIGSFWAVECLARRGDRDAAREAFERLLACAGPVGLFAEEIDPETGAALGNFPQAYTHVGLINAALSLQAPSGSDARGEQAS